MGQVVYQLGNCNLFGSGLLFKGPFVSVLISLVKGGHCPMMFF